MGPQDDFGLQWFRPRSPVYMWNPNKMSLNLQCSGVFWVVLKRNVSSGTLSLLDVDFPVGCWLLVGSLISRSSNRRVVSGSGTDEFILCEVFGLFQTGCDGFGWAPWGPTDGAVETILAASLTADPRPRPRPRPIPRRAKKNKVSRRQRMLHQLVHPNFT